ncbi:nucleotidyltransferase family protein [Rhodalgimonas zhirmunskyi]|uniref:Nucleotidyltransferase family protein n=1 Tax=Rhodalgimonas zhirmunskyi TaxID=2964767 RepID=A0AAJ1X4J7_9RHOB|nr:nucleotidyltransferase family protein [Rhodoalgimonas zhirmunskyi]MDQ2094328.1 nucleotidyltransferase family protein [Rhodoalgimonas zhirmunskyi]
MRDRPETPDALMLFAAGFGTRMGALTADRPKPMIEVAGRPLIDHALDLVAPMDLSRVVVNTHYKPAPLHDHLSQRDVMISHEDDILETGGGLRKALPLLGEGPVFTMNSDAVFRGPNPLALLRAAWRPGEMDALLLCVPLERAIGHTGEGDFLLGQDGQLSRGKGEVYAGIQILDPTGLNEIDQPAFSLNLLWNRMQPEGRLFGISYPGQWCDVGRPEGIALAEEMLEFPDV